MSKLIGKRQGLIIRGRTSLAVSILLLSLSGIAYSLPAEDIEIINDREYFPRVHQLLQQASHSIYVIMFSVRYYDKYPNSPSNILLKDLADAKKRGLKVKIILEQGVSAYARACTPYRLYLPARSASAKAGSGRRASADRSKSSGWFSRKNVQPEQHQRVVQFLKQHGVPYTLDSPDICTHAKLIIIDELYTVIGSTNWSYSAITKNHETAVIIKSREVAKSYIDYFQQIQIQP